MSARRRRQAWSRATRVARPDPNPEWRERAACRFLPQPGRDAAKARVDLFYATPEVDRPERRMSAAEAAAVAICARCEVRNPCREYALEAREEHGIYGGMTPKERMAIIKAGRAS